MTADISLHSPQPRRRAYSYLRFSTPEQSKGDSFRRQMAMANAYAVKHGLELDRELTFHDVGVSAYRGQNADAGRLAYFVEAVRSGQVPQGSVLLVEQLDRLSRLAPRKAMRVLEEIVELGVSVVTLNDEREYTTASLDRDPMDLLVSILTFIRANEESATKSRRLKEAWKVKRAQSNDRPLTSRLPAWLKLSEDRQRIEVIEERAALVRRIFDMSLSGVGQHKIAETFNLESLAPWGDGGRRGKHWHRSYIAKVLTNPAVTGIFQPHVTEYDGSRMRRKPLEVVEGYFPKVISPEVFHEAQVVRQARGAPQRGRHAHAPISNILAGLAVCPKCGSTMTRVVKGRRARPSFVCSRAKAGAGCRYRSVPYQAIETALFVGLPERLRDLEGVEREDGLAGEVAIAEHSVDDLRERARILLDNLSYANSPALLERLRDTETELEIAEKSLRGLRERQEAHTGRTIGARVAKAIDALQPPEGDPVVSDVNRAMRTIFKQAVIDWEGQEVALEWAHGGICSVPYTTFTKFTGPGWTWDQQEEVG